MAFEQKDGQGSLFVNDKKQSDKHPDYSGTCMINGAKYKIAGWKKTPEGKKPYLSLSIQEFKNNTVNVQQEQDLPF